MGGQLRFRVLGPLAVTVGESGVPLGGPRQRTVLALLLLVPGRVVPIDTMVEAVWRSGPPQTARTQVAICVAALRKSFKAAGVGGDVIVTAHPGYVLNTEGYQFDAVDFAHLVQAGGAGVREGRLAEAGKCFAQALELWRGPAFAGVAGQLVEEEAARLEECRLNAYDDSVRVELDLGRHQELVPVLAGMVREHPLRERLRHHLMLAQYRSGRRADAMETFREARSLFIEELGIEPGPDLRELHDAVLRDDPALASVAQSAAEASPPPADIDAETDAESPGGPMAGVPAELPPGVPAFAGRVEELAALDCLLSGEGDGAAVGLVTGAAGTGKSGLAVRWAVGAAGWFPDGQLFADLRGYDGQYEPVAVRDVLSRFLRSLGVPGELVPDDLEERTALYRSVLADRRVLIVLDNARTWAQVRPLLPGGSRCCVLVTSRDQMEDLVTWPPQARVHLGLLSRAEALELLTAIVGEERIGAARADAVRLVELCDRLPLALRIAAARLASRPHWTVAHLVARLSDERGRLDELSAGESQVRASLALSYRCLDEEAARLLRRLGLLDAPEFTAWAGAAMLECGVLHAERLVETLVDAQLLEVASVDVTGRLRYRLHTLVRLYARERAAEEESQAQRERAVTRFLSLFLAVAREADRREDSTGGTGVHSALVQQEVDAELLDELLGVPLTWYEAERLALVASVRQAARMGLAEYAWDLTVCAGSFFGTRSYTEDWRQCCQEALAAARTAGDLRGQGAMLYGLGVLELGHGQVADSEARFQEALDCFTAAGEEHGRAMTLRCLAQGDRIRGDLDRAMARFAQALPVFRAVGDRLCEAHTLSNMAETELDAGRPGAAMQFALDAVALEEARGIDTRNLAQSLYRLGRVHAGVGQSQQAEESFLRAVRIVREKADLVGLAFTLLGLGETRLDAGRTDLARATLTDALEVAQQSRNPMVTGRINLALGQVHHRLGDAGTARGHLNTAQQAFHSVGAPAWAQRAQDALDNLGALTHH